MIEPNGHAPESPPEWEVVARLTPAERSEVYWVDQAIRLLDVQRRTMQAGAQQLWAMLREKYQLAPDTLYDPPSGSFVRRVLSSSAPDGPVGSGEPEPSPPAPELALAGKPPRKRGKRGRR